MIAGVREYLLSVIATSLLSSVLLSLVPKGSVHRTLTFLCGLAMLLTALGPVVRLDFDAMAQALSRTHLQAAEAAEGVTADNSELIADIIKEEAQAYIWDKADSMGASLSEVEVEVQTDGTYPYPYSVSISGNCTAEQQDQLSRLLEEELAIPAERQEWHTDEAQ